MTNEFVALMELFSNAAHGNSISVTDFNKKIDFSKLYKLSKEQAIFTIIYPYICNMNLAFNFEDDKKALNMEQEFLASIAKSIQCRLFVHELLKQFKECGIKYALLKGESLAILYKESNTRISGDTDIYVYEEDSPYAIDILRKKGYIVADCGGYDYKCYHKIYGLL